MIRGAMGFLAGLAAGYAIHRAMEARSHGLRLSEVFSTNVGVLLVPVKTLAAQKAIAARPVVSRRPAAPSLPADPDGVLPIQDAEFVTN